MKMKGAAGEAQLSKDASPMQAAEEPPNLKNPNQRWRKLGRIAWDLAGSAFKNKGSRITRCE